MPRPRFPTEPSKKKPATPAFPKRTVDDALRPPKSERAVEVALVFTPKLLVGVQANEPLPPQALPVLEMTPVAEKVAHPAAPPALETMRLVVEAVPVTASALVVAAVPVAFRKVMFWRVEEPVTARLVWSARAEKKLVEVALVEVAVSDVKLKSVEDACARRPLVKVSIVEVEFEEKRYPKFA